MKVNLPKVDGCRSVTVLAQIEDPLAFTLVESWDSRELHGVHIGKLAANGQWEFIAGHLAADPASAYFSEI